jgi:Tfp pilus assembly protein PilX
MSGTLRRRRGRETGAALALALVAVLLLGLLLAGIALMTVGDLDIGRATRWDAVALYLAEAGMEDQVYRLKADKDAGPIGVTVSPADGTVAGLSLRYATRIKCLENCGGNPSSRVWEVSSWGMLVRQSDNTPLQRRTVVAQVEVTYTGSGPDLNRFPSSVSFLQWEERYPSPAIPAQDVTPPSVTLTSPADDARVNGIVTIAATASDDVWVTRVDFYVDGVLHSSDLSNPYSASWDTTALGEGSTHTLTAKAFDAAGNQGTAEVTVKVRNVPWWDAAWGYRKKVTIDYTKVAANLTDFPVLISLPTDTGLAAHARTDGNDIAFTAADGTTKLSHEIEAFTKATGRLVAWVKVPSLSSTQSTVLYLYYGNAAASNQQNATAVWDANYQAVWHLKENPAGTAPQMKDSTSNARHGTTVGSMPSGAQIAGQINGALDFDNTDDRVDTSNFLSSGVTQLTAEAWVYKKDTTGDDRVVAKTDTTSLTATYIFSLAVAGSTITARLATAGGSATSHNGTQAVAVNTWTHLAFTWDGSNIRIYRNGQLAGGPFAKTGTMNASSRIIVIANNDDIPNNRYWNGTLDEVRLSTVARSAQWLQTQYNNQSSPSTFSVLGAEDSY